MHVGTLEVTDALRARLLAGATDLDECARLALLADNAAVAARQQPANVEFAGRATVVIHLMQACARCETLQAADIEPVLVALRLARDAAGDADQWIACAPQKLDPMKIEGDLTRCRLTVEPAAFAGPALRAAAIR